MTRSKYATCWFILNFLLFGFVVLRGGKFKKDETGDEEEEMSNSTHQLTHDEQRALRKDASITVVVIFIFIMPIFLYIRR